jgi:hypothetical protein
LRHLSFTYTASIAPIFHLFHEQERAHVTNVNHDRDKGKGQAYRDSLKWSWEMVDEYLMQEGLVEENVRWTEDQLLPHLKHVVLPQILAAGLPYLQFGPGRFELLGLDFLVDQELNIFISEVQPKPGLAMDTFIKEKLVPPVLEGAINLALLFRADPTPSVEDLQEAMGDGYVEVFPLDMSNNATGSGSVVDFEGGAQHA